MADAQLYTDLRSQIASNAHAAACQTAEEILEADPENLSVFQALAVALINESKFADVIKACNKNSKLARDCAFEHAYALYRTQKFSEALKVIEKGESSNPVALIKLEAQVKYRLGRYDECIELYHQLMDDHGIQSSEVLTNLTAAYTSSGQGRRGLEDVFGGTGDEADIPDNMFEVVYNAACASIDMGALNTAKEQLAHAQEVCQTVLESEDFTEDEIRGEMAIVLCQLAYIHQQQNRPEDAMSVYQDVLKSGTSDATVTAVASNNIISLHKNQDYFDSYKKSKAITSDTLETKLTTVQRQIFAFNRALLLVYMGKKGKELDTQVDSLSKLSSNDDDLPALVTATRQYKEKNYEAAQKTLRSFIDQNKSGDNTVRLQLALAQMLYLQGDASRSADVLSSVQSMQHQPAMVATLVDLHTQSGNIKAASAVLDAACEHWDNAMDADGVDASTLKIRMIKANASYRLAHGDYDAALALYENLLDANPDDTEVLAGMVQVASHVDPDLAAEYANQLPGLGDPMDDKEKEALENAAIVTQRRRAPVAEEGDAAGKDGDDADGDAKKRKNPDGLITRKKKKKKPRYPKGFDPNDPSNKPYDPSHWIKKRDRYRRRRRGPISRGGHQGAQESEKDRQKRIRQEQEAAEKAEREAARAAEAEKQAQAPPKPQKKSRRQKKKK